MIVLVLLGVQLVMMATTYAIITHYDAQKGITGEEWDNLLWATIWPLSLFIITKDALERREAQTGKTFNPLKIYTRRVHARYEARKAAEAAKVERERKVGWESGRQSRND